MTAKKQTILLLTLIFLPPIFILLSREFFTNNYFFSSLYKIIFLSPILYRLYIEGKNPKQSIIENFVYEKFRKNIFSALSIGILLSLVYLASFFLFQDSLDTQTIITKLQDIISLNHNNILFIGLYIIVINSLLEEFFWRGFLFAKLQTLITPWKASVISGIAFSFHHMMFYSTWFTPVFFIIATLGLVLYSIIMNFLYQKYQDVLSCWLVHAMVDTVQIFIALKIFGII